jgi:predicted PurR-regulated permease PerM
MFLEIIGITLAYIEIRYKPLANKIEGKILLEETRIRNFASRLNDNKIFMTLATIFFVFIFFLDIPYLVGFFDRIVPDKWQGTLMVVIQLTVPIIVFFVAGVAFVVFADFVSWLNQFSNGHAIGALGVVVTFLGLLGESYQVITILTHR